MKKTPKKRMGKMKSSKIYKVGISVIVMMGLMWLCTCGVSFGDRGYEIRMEYPGGVMNSDQCYNDTNVLMDTFAGCECSCAEVITSIPSDRKLRLKFRFADCDNKCNKLNKVILFENLRKVEGRVMPSGVCIFNSVECVEFVTEEMPERTCC